MISEQEGGGGGGGGGTPATFARQEEEDVDDDEKKGEECEEDPHDKKTLDGGGDRGPAPCPGASKEGTVGRSEGVSKEPNEKRWFNPGILAATIETIKYLYSAALLVFSVALVMGAMFTYQTVGTAGDGGIPPVAAFFVFWFLLVWLAVMEGGQGALVGLQPINTALYADTHPWALRSAALVHNGDNMGRFIVGRQFLVVLVVFLSNLMASSIPGANLFGLPPGVLEVFLDSNVALMLTTVAIGQLSAQVNASRCMLDFINNRFVLVTAYVSLAIEVSGLLHSVYLVQTLFAKIAGRPLESANEPPRAALQQAWFWVRVVASFALLGYAFAVTLTALFQGQTTMWAGIPPAVSVVVFFVLMALAGMMEGMQIALFAVVNLPKDELRNHHPMAHKTCQLAFRGPNLPAFLIGRQILVTVCTFVIARIATPNVVVGDDGSSSNNIFGVSDGLQAFFNTGLLGAVITTIVASLAWRIVASSFPVAFLSNPLVYLLVRLCLVLELTGICSAAWLLAWMQKKVLGYEPDEVYLGTPQERAEAAAAAAAKNKEEPDLEADSLGAALPSVGLVGVTMPGPAGIGCDGPPPCPEAAIAGGAERADDEGGTALAPAARGATEDGVPNGSLGGGSRPPGGQRGSRNAPPCIKPSGLGAMFRWKWW